MRGETEEDGREGMKVGVKSTKMGEIKRAKRREKRSASHDGSEQSGVEKGARLDDVGGGGKRKGSTHTHTHAHSEIKHVPAPRTGSAGGHPAQRS